MLTASNINEKPILRSFTIVDTRYLVLYPCSGDNSQSKSFVRQVTLRYEPHGLLWCDSTSIQFGEQPMVRGTVRGTRDDPVISTHEGVSGRSRFDSLC